MIARLVTVALLVTMAVFQAQAADKVPAVPPDVEKAVLAEDWAKIAQLIGEVKPETSSPQRLLLGHAYLALNRNNESFRLFANATPADLAAWELWTKNLVGTHPQHSQAHFYRADALARLDRYEDAIMAFTAAIELNPKNAYALHGRGVLHTQLGKFDEAGKDLAAAQTSNPGIADFYNSRGMLRVAQRQGNLVRLKEQFNKAKDLSNDFALAHHGLGCIALLRGQTGAAEHLEVARNLLDEARVAFASNETGYQMAIVLTSSVTASSVDFKEPGTTIERWIAAPTMARMTEQYRNYQSAEKSIPWTNPFGKLEARARVGIVQTALTLAADKMPVQEMAKMDSKTHSTLVGALQNEKNSIGSNERFASTSENIAALGANALTATVTKEKFVSGLVGLGVKEGLKDLYKPTHAYSTLTTNILDRVQHIAPTGLSRDFSTTPNARSVTQNPNGVAGGIATDRHEVGWDNTPWPFMPIFGLLYAPMVADALQKEISNGAPTAEEKGRGGQQ